MAVLARFKRKADAMAVRRFSKTSHCKNRPQSDGSGLHGQIGGTDKIVGLCHHLQHNRRLAYRN
jgi:hypothetical protein